MRLAANVSMLFPDLPLPERIPAARDAGFDGVEILFPYEHPARDLLDRLDAARMPVALINAPPPNYTGGPRGFAAVPGLEERFRSDFRRAARMAGALGARHVHVMAGAADGPAARAAFVENLRWAAAAAPAQSLTIEPINRGDLPGYFLADFGLALEVLAEVAAPNLRLQFDGYHAARIEGDAVAVWDRVRAHVAHVQIASPEGRHEPDDPASRALLDRLAADGYAGWVSAEYVPRGDTRDGLGWLAACRA